MFVARPDQFGRILIANGLENPAVVLGNLPTRRRLVDVQGTIEVRHVPEPIHFLQHTLQGRVREQTKVELTVGFLKLWTLLARFRLVDLLLDSFQLGDVDATEIDRRQDLRFEQASHQVELGKIFAAESGDGVPSVGLVFEDALCLQGRKCLTDRNSADVQPLGELALVDFLSRQQLTRDDHLPDLLQAALRTGWFLHGGYDSGRVDFTSR